MKKLTVLILTIIILLSSTVTSVLSEGRDFLTFVSTYYWALGQRLDDIPHTPACFTCILPEDENYVVYYLQGGLLTLDSHTDKVVEFDSLVPVTSIDQSLLSSLVMSLEYEFADLRVSGSQEEFLASKWNSVSDIVSTVYSDGSYESDHYIYDIEFSEYFHVIEKEYAAAIQQ